MMSACRQRERENHFKFHREKQGEVNVTHPSPYLLGSFGSFLPAVRQPELDATKEHPSDAPVLKIEGLHQRRPDPVPAGHRDRGLVRGPRIIVAAFETNNGQNERRQLFASLNLNTDGIHVGVVGRGGVVGRRDQELASLGEQDSFRPFL